MSGVGGEGEFEAGLAEAGEDDDGKEEAITGPFSCHVLLGVRAGG